MLSTTADDDVKAEASAVLGEGGSSLGSRQVAIVARRMYKIFKNAIKWNVLCASQKDCKTCCTYACCCCCCHCTCAIPCVNREKGFQAVSGITYAIDRNQTFCLLGHNGAGKTTTINCLVGNHSISAGSAEIDGLSVQDEMDAIRAKMGVCPQHDVLWRELTSTEHIELFCGIKGIPKDQVSDEVRTRLESVALTFAKDVAAGSCVPARSWQLHPPCAVQSEIVSPPVGTRVACDADSQSRSPSSASPRWSFSTSRPLAWTLFLAVRSGTLLRRQRKAGLWCSQPTPWRRQTHLETGSAS